jgi:pSer/pThr/pTyr-binding forkhead associated (FHA) protein
MAFELVILSGPCRCGDSIQLSPRQPFVIGRELEADVRFRSDLEMSSAHFSIEATEDYCKISDLGSTNGTFLNGCRITHEIARNGDEIRAGNTTFEIVLAESLAPAPIAGSPVINQRDLDSSGTGIRITTEDGDYRDLAFGSRITIGRNDLAEWIFASDVKISSLHFAIQTMSGQWEVVDLSSTNGTLLNGRRIEKAWLNANDEILAGSTRFTIHLKPVCSVKRVDQDIPFNLNRNQEYDADGRAHEVGQERSIYKNEPSDPTSFRIPEVTNDRWGMSPEPPTLTPSASLRCLTRDDWTITILPGDHIVVGRSSSADLSIPEDLKISSRHASLRFESDHCLLTDLTSTNGTFVNGRRIVEERLNNGDRILMGDAEFKFEIAFDPTNPIPPAFVNDTVENDEARFPEQQYVYRPDPADEYQLSYVSADTSPDVNEEPAVEAVVDPTLAPERSPTPTPLPRTPLSVSLNESHVLDEIPYEAFPCGSGLILFRGGSARFDPIDVARRLLLASPGWMVTKRASDPALGLSDHAATSTSFAFDVTPLPADDVGWMLPWSEQWGRHQSLIVYSRSDAKRIESSFEQLHRLLNMTDRHALFAPESLSDFLANRLQDTVNRFFSPLDAVLVELSSGKRWAYFAPKDLEKVLPDLRFRRRRTW